MSAPEMKIIPCPPVFILTVRVTVAASNVEPFFKHFKGAYDTVLAEPECVFFIAGQNTRFGQPQPSPTVKVQGKEEEEEEVELVWTEGWVPPEDRRADGGVGWFMEVQMKKDYYEPYLKATEPMFIKPRTFEIVTPQKDMCHFKAPE